MSEPKFIQIAATNNEGFEVLFALDEEGRVWSYWWPQLKGDMWTPGAWRRLSDRRVVGDE